MEDNTAARSLSTGQNLTYIHIISLTVLIFFLSLYDTEQRWATPVHTVYTWRCIPVTFSPNHTLAVQSQCLHSFILIEQ